MLNIYDMTTTYQKTSINRTNNLLTVKVDKYHRPLIIIRVPTNYTFDTKNVFCFI